MSSSNDDRPSRQGGSLIARRTLAFRSHVRKPWPIRRIQRRGLSHAGSRQPAALQRGRVAGSLHPGVHSRRQNLRRRSILGEVPLTLLLSAHFKLQGSHNLAFSQHSLLRPEGAFSLSAGPV